MKSETSDSGFTLIEVLVSVTILAVGILAVLEAFSLSLRAGTRASRLQKAVAIAQRKMEVLSASSGENLQPESDSSGEYAWQVQIAELPQGLASASIEVKWFERGALQKFKLSQIFLPRSEETD